MRIALDTLIESEENKPNESITVFYRVDRIFGVSNDPKNKNGCVLHVLDNDGKPEEFRLVDPRGEVVRRIGAAMGEFYKPKELKISTDQYMRLLKEFGL